MEYRLAVLGVLCRAKLRGSGVGMPVCVASMVLKSVESEAIRDALDDLEQRQLIWCVREADDHIAFAGPTRLGYWVGRLHGYYSTDSSTDTESSVADGPTSDRRAPLPGVAIAVRCENGVGSGRLSSVHG